MEEILPYIPQAGAYVGLVFALVYAVRRTLQQDDEWERIVKQKDADNAILRTEITQLKAELKEKDRKR